MAAAFLVCSECFNNQGLKSKAKKLGDRVRKACPNCGSVEGAKLRKPILERLVHRFFVQGTIPHGVGGRVSILKFNPHADLDDVDLDESTSADWALIKSKIRGRLFYNAPRLWEIGITDHYDNALQIDDSAIVGIVSKLRVKIIPAGSLTFRIRKNLTGSSPLQPPQYGIPPQITGREFGRLDSAEIPLLYTSPSLPVCLHECRVAITNDIFVATFKANYDLKLANLAGDYDQGDPPPTEPLVFL